MLDTLWYVMCNYIYFSKQQIIIENFLGRNRYVQGCAPPFPGVPTQGCEKSPDGSIQCYCSENKCNTKKLVDTMN